MKNNYLAALFGIIALLPPIAGFSQPAPARMPFGIYAKPNIDTCVTYANSDTNISTGDCITNTIVSVLSNPAVSGVATFLRWSNICPSVPAGSLTSTNGTTNWYVLDDVFGAVAYFNSTNTGYPPKTVQLVLQAGFHAPQWILNQLTSCDAMFLTNGTVNTNLVTNTCGCATFISGEGPNVPNIPKPLPLPWNPIYTNAWANFTRAVGRRYGTNPLLVTVVVGGPTSDSSEMILPNESNDPTNWVKWNPLFSLSFPSNYQNSDQAFIDAWERAIDMYAQAFSNTTLACTTGNGLPNFTYTNASGSVVPYATFTVPPGFTWPPGSVKTNDHLSDLMDAAAESTILAYFADPRHGGNNAKAVQEDGMVANEINNKPLGGMDLGSHGIKWLAQSTANGQSALAGTSNVLSRLLGGLQFDASVVDYPAREGCTNSDGCTNSWEVPSPEQACYNMLRVYFDGTGVAGYYNLSNAGFPLNYVQIFSDDIIYASTNAMPSNVVDGFGATNLWTFQSELTNASAQIFQIADAVLYIQQGANSPQLYWPAAASPYQLQFKDTLSSTNAWKTNANTISPTLTNGFYQVGITAPATKRFYRLALP